MQFNPMDAGPFDWVLRAVITYSYVEAIGIHIYSINACECSGSRCRLQSQV